MLRARVAAATTRVVQEKGSMASRGRMAYWCVLACLVGWSGQRGVSSAATLNLADVPLALAFPVEPNVVFVIDDSGSMDWEVLTQDFSHDGRYTSTQPNGTSPPGSGEVKHRDSNDDGVPDCGFGADGGQTAYGYVYGVEFATNTDTDDARDCNTADDEEWRFRTSAFNTLYFDPERSYVPWAGVDAAGAPYQDMDVRAAKDNPYDPHSRTIDLTRHNSNWVGGVNDRATSDRNSDGVPDGFRYYTWQDGKQDGINNGRFDNGEETVHFIKDAPPTVQQNFANWFSYYRKREYVAKAVYSHAIAHATGVRMGLVTVNHNRNTIKPTLLTPDTPLRSMNVDYTTGPKRALLEALFAIRGEGGTALRRTLWDVGRYVEGAAERSLFSTDDAYLSAAEGGACQQSFVVLMTDGFDNSALSSGPGNADGNGNTAFDGGAYADNIDNTLADVAMHYYERDLRPGLPDRLAVSTTDPAAHQHLVTLAVTFSGLHGSLTSEPGPDTDGRTFWTDPFAHAQFKLDDLRHAAFNGRGLFFQASDVTSLSNALRRTLSSITQRTSSVAPVTVNTGARSTESRLYQARFDSTDWSGQLLSVSLDPLTGEVSQNPVEAIDSGALLDTRLKEQNYHPNSRTILTWKPSTSSGIPFQWSALDAEQQQLLHTDSHGVLDLHGQARLDYVRGSNVDERPLPRGRGFRVRQHTLGDIVHSTPFFVDTPQLGDSEALDPSGEYAAFRARYAQRMKMVVVGSNDGMLHVFNANEPVTTNNPHGDAQAGQEVLAYVPHATMRHLSALTAPTYRHRFSVDGSPTAGDALMTPPGGVRGWYTVVVSGLRSGGQGYFALNITDPTQFGETPAQARQLVLWEFTDSDDADLGFSFSQPQIVRMANGRWAAVLGNGYNNTVADGHASTNGHATLFVIFLDGPQGLDGAQARRWVEGQNYIKIDTGVGDVATPNGLATPAVIDVAGQGTAQYIVAGDLQGNLWRFDVTSDNPLDWKQPASVTRLFVATDATGTRPQPITTRPEVGLHPENLEGFVVYFGTGKYLESSDKSTANATPQTFYGIWDRQGRAVTRSELLPQTFLTETTVTDAQDNVRTVRMTSNTPIDWQQHSGWYLDFPTPGERQVSDAVLRNGRIVFTTLIPNEQPCSFGGSSFLVALDVNGGTRPAFTIFDVNRDKVLSPADNLPGNGLVVNALRSDIGIIGTPTLQASGEVDIAFLSGSSGSTEGTAVDPGPGAVARQAWRQITQ